MGKRLHLIIYIALLAFTTAQAQLRYAKTDSICVASLLSKADSKSTTLWFATQFVGRPYVAHTLEVGDSEQLVVNTRQLDCTTLVETVCALWKCAHSGQRSFCDYCRWLRTLRYRQGKTDGYASRLHYFSDWILDNESMQLVDELQQPVPPFSARQQLNINYMSSHPQAYSALKRSPSLLPVIRQQEQQLTGKSFRYIPKKAIRNTALMRQTVHDGDIIAITCNKPGLDIAHLGFAVWRSDGLHLLNASMLHKRVVVEPMTLYSYMQKHPSFTGIRVIRLKE